ncbi:MAG: DUF3024 domain-containing protein [Novosphingobium sp.]
MSIAATLSRRTETPACGRHPNELDLMRITRAIARRARYRYVDPSVETADDGYLIRSPCCSRTIDPDGGEIDVAMLCWDEAAGQWSLFRKDHKAACWIEDSRYGRLAELLERLNADPARLFWQ